MLHVFAHGLGVVLVPATVAAVVAIHHGIAVAQHLAHSRRGRSTCWLSAVAAGTFLIAWLFTSSAAPLSQSTVHSFVPDTP